MRVSAVSSGFTVISCYVLLTVAQQHEITGFLRPDTREMGPYEGIVSATVDLLPDVSSVLDGLSGAASTSDVSSTGYIGEVLDKFVPLSKKVYIANAKVKGLPISQDQISRLNAAEFVLPPVFEFMKRMGASKFFDKEPESVSAAGFSAGNFDFKVSPSNLGGPPDSPKYGRYTKMVAAVNNLLPVLADVFQKIADDPDRPDPTDPDFIEKMMLAFLPASKEILQAAAKAEGRVPRKEELDHLDNAEPVMPNVINFMERLRKSNYYNSAANTPLSPTFSAGAFKFDDQEKTTLLRSYKTPKLPGQYDDPGKWSVGSSSVSRLPNYEYTVPKPEGYFEVYKGTSLAARPSSRSSLPTYKYTV